MNSTSNSGKQWIAFAQQVLKHIDNYCVPQYGDAPDDAASKFSAEKIISQIERYCARFGKNSREGQDLLDLLKVAHYASILSTKLDEKPAPKWEATGTPEFLTEWFEERFGGDKEEFKLTITRL